MPLRRKQLEPLRMAWTYTARPGSRYVLSLFEYPGAGAIRPVTFHDADYASTVASPAAVAQFSDYSESFQIGFTSAV